MSKRKENERERKQQQYLRERQQVENFRKDAALKKQQLRQAGCVLPFYEFLDSFNQEFERIAEYGRKTYPSLLGIHEVPDDIFDSDEWWKRLGYIGLTRIEFPLADGLGYYGKGNRKGLTIAGVTSAFHDENGNLKTIVMIPRSVKGWEHPELKYRIKIPALAHEIGHVHDLENGLNFNTGNRTCDIVEAEVFANLYALDLLASRQIVCSYELLRDALRDAIPGDGYVSKVARGVVDRLPEHKLVKWPDFLASIGDGKAP